MIKSVICELLGIEKPIFQGGMAWIADARLAAAVSNAGGLGLISSINFGTEAVRTEIRKARALTDKPFGVNIMLAAPNAAEIADLVVMQELGASAVVAEGAESGGHVGDTHTMALVPQVIDAVDIPVLAAGGIFDGRGAAAMFLMGACGVQVGTRFLVADECLVHDTYKERLIKASDVGTMVTGKSLGDDVDLKSIARGTAGFAGADLENLLNEAAILAVRNNRRFITQPDIDEAILPPGLRPRFTEIDVYGT